LGTPFRLALARFRDLPVLRLAGDMVFGENVRELHDRITQLTGQGHRRLILDVSELGLADSTGIGALIDAKKLVGGGEGEVILLRPSDRLRASLKLIRVTPMFVLVNDDADLIQHLDDAASGTP
jgi:anti-anti-sigma factor